MTRLPGNRPAVQLVLDAKAKLGEGAIWHHREQKLYWVDIEGKALNIFDPQSGINKKLDVGQRVGTVVPIHQGGALVALQNGIHRIDTDTGAVTFLHNPLPPAYLRFNDGKCDPSGRFWVGSMALDFQEKAGSLYRFHPDKSIHRVLDNLTISNGIAWSSDRKTMYLNDTPTLTVQAFDYDDYTGEISNRRVAIRIPENMGAPDGMTIDAENNLWVAMWGGGMVCRFDPATARLLQQIIIPAPHVTSCAFGGEQLDTLYITTSRDSMTSADLEQFPFSGGLFAVTLPGVRGVPAFFYDDQ